MRTVKNAGYGLTSGDIDNSDRKRDSRQLIDQLENYLFLTG